MILNEINYKMAIYRDCTLGEIILVGSLIVSVEGGSLFMIFKILCGYGGIGLGLTLLTFYHMTKLSLTRLQKIKYGKPHGYYKHLLIKKLSEKGILNQVFLTKESKWSVRRMTK